MKYLFLLSLLLLFPVEASAAPIRAVNTFHLNLKGTVRSMDLSKDGSKLAMGTIWLENNALKGELYVISYDNGAKLWSREGVWLKVSWSPDGRLAAAEYDSSKGLRVSVFSGDGDLLFRSGWHPVSSNPGYQSTYFRWSPHGKGFIYVYGYPVRRGLVFYGNSLVLELSDQYIDPMWSVNDELLINCPSKGYLVNSSGAFTLDGFPLWWSPDGEMYFLVKGNVQVISRSGRKLLEIRGRGSPALGGWSPNSDIVWVTKSSGEVSLTFYDLNGNVIKKESYKPSELELSWLDSDAYVLASCVKESGELKVYYYKGFSNVWKYERRLRISGPIRKIKLRAMEEGNRVLVHVKYLTNTVNSTCSILDRRGNLIWSEDNYLEPVNTDYGVLAYKYVGRSIRVDLITWNGHMIQLSSLSRSIFWRPPAFVAYSWMGRSVHGQLGPIYERTVVEGYRLEGPSPVPEKEGRLTDVVNELIELLRENKLMVLVAVALIVIVLVRRR